MAARADPPGLRIGQPLPQPFHEGTLHCAPRKVRSQFSASAPEFADVHVVTQDVVPPFGGGTPSAPRGISLTYVDRSVDYTELAHKILARKRNIPPCFTYTRNAPFLNSRFIVDSVDQQFNSRVAHVVLTPTLPATLDSLHLVGQCTSPSGAWAKCFVQLKGNGEPAELEDVPPPTDNVLRCAFALLALLLEDDEYAFDVTLYRILLSRQELAYAPLFSPSTITELRHSYYILLFKPLLQLLHTALTRIDPYDEERPVADLPGFYSVRALVDPARRDPLACWLPAALPDPLILYMQCGQASENTDAKIPFKYSEPPRYNLDYLLRNAGLEVGQSFLRSCRTSLACGTEYLRALPSPNVPSVINRIMWSCSVDAKIFPGRDADDLQRLLLTKGGADVFAAYLECISNEAALESPPLELGRLLLCEKAFVLEEEVVAASFHRQYSFKHSMITIFNVQSLPQKTGNDFAAAFYSALRMFQTHVLKTSQSSSSYSSRLPSARCPSAACTSKMDAHGSSSFSLHWRQSRGSHLGFSAMITLFMLTIAATSCLPHGISGSMCVPAS
eukprot:m.17981 g.17981  ORF g.17981 m.17981 type:complete len:560 (-) comp3296_c1_seq1:445-2124(-)